MPTNEVTDEYMTDRESCCFESLIAYSKDLEQGISNRVVGKDFKRILISTVQVRKDYFHDLLSTYESDVVGSS